MSPDRKIRVVAADDQAIVRQGLLAVLSHADHIEVIGEAASGDAALAMVLDRVPEVLVTDVEMPGLDGIELAARLRSLGSPTRIVVFTQHDEPAFVRAALEAGVGGYLLKNALGPALIAAIEAVAAGRAYIGLPPDHPAIAVALGAPAPALSRREQDVLELLALGYSQRDIGARLHISAKTVSTYRARLFEKLSIRDRSDLVLHALAEGVLTPARARRERRRRDARGGTDESS